MKRASLLLLQVILLTATVHVAMATDAGMCRKLLSVERAVENDNGESARAAERAYVDCRGETFPLDIRIAAYTRYGDAKVSAGEMQAAVDVYRDALTVLDTMKRPDVELILSVLDRLSEIENEARHPEDALSHAKRAADLRAARYGTTSPEAAIGLLRLGIAHVVQKDFSSADRYIGEAIRISKSTCGPTCDALSEAYAARSTWYGDQGNTVEADRYANLSVAAAPTQPIRRAKQ
jgi:tetratricopeptide (TPR) repeat protein